MEKVEVKFGEWIENGFNLYKDNFGILVLASLVAVVLSAVTIGVLAGPMFAGVLLITLGLFDKQDPNPELLPVCFRVGDCPYCRVVSSCPCALCGATGRHIRNLCGTGLSHVRAIPYR